MTQSQLPPNQGQNEAAEAFFEFLFSDEKEFRISGPAGVGKTFWMGHIIDVIMPRYHETCKLVGLDTVYDGVVMTATTNKAAEVLEQSTGRPTQTLHSFLNLTVYEDYSTGKTKIKKNPRTWMVHERLIVFVDEASMTDTELHKVLHEGTHNCKIVYVGDKDQLAPVMEKLSPVYANPMPEYELTEQMRTNVPELQAIHAQLRETVRTGIFKPIKEVPGIIDFLDNDRMQAELAKTFSQQTKASRILAYTNRRVMEFNEHIRDLRQLPTAFGPGEILVNNSAIRMGNKSMLSVETEVTILKNHGSDYVTVEPNVDLAIDYLDFVSTSLGETHIRVPYATDRAHFDNLVKHYKKISNWERFFYLKQTFPDLRQRDAATVHKSQGSTYDTVFVDLGNISTCTQVDQTARMLYVAFSRARQRVYLFGNLADKYGGMIPA